ncbi:MAG TPA: sigma-70 family RNA polymerase sigma factor [Vicinamibacteria bacterium]|nr:sigma-70 family RNA polymerase sigma factor [Vicinamibacteria bacterium]
MGDGSASLDLGRLRNRRPEAVRVWFESYFAVVHRFVRHRVAACPSLADDVTQDTFLVALKQIHKFDPERGAMLPWLTYIARNCARKALRGTRPGSPVEQVLDGVEMLPDLAAAPLAEAQLGRIETLDRVHAALSLLAPHHQRVLESHYLLEQPLTQIAAAEVTTVGAVKSLLHRARLAFKVAFAGGAGEADSWAKDSRDPAHRRQKAAGEDAYDS